MKRRVLIIGSPLSGSSHLIGVGEDVQNFYRYVRSSIGGVYDRTEIVYFKHPNLLQIADTLKACEESEILTIYFSGHGFRHNNADFICLNDSEDFAVSRFLNVNAKRKLIMIDSCRTPIDTKEYGDVISGIGYHFPTDYPHYSRRLYCEYINQSPRGTALIFSTSENQPASDSEAGGVYTKSLMTVLHNWPNIKREKMITIGRAFKESVPISKEYEPIQTPKLYYHQDKAALHIPLGVNPVLHLKPNLPRFNPTPRMLLKKLNG